MSYERTQPPTANGLSIDTRGMILAQLQRRHAELLEFDPNYEDEEYDRVMERIRDDDLDARGDEPPVSESDEETEEDDPRFSDTTSSSSSSGPIATFTSPPSTSGVKRGLESKEESEGEEVQLKWSFKTTIRELIAFEPEFGKGKKMLRIHNGEPVFY